MGDPYIFNLILITLLVFIKSGQNNTNTNVINKLHVFLYRIKITAQKTDRLTVIGLLLKGFLWIRNPKKKHFTNSKRVFHFTLFQTFFYATRYKRISIVNEIMQISLCRRIFTREMGTTGEALYFRWWSSALWLLVSSQPFIY